MGALATRASVTPAEKLARIRRAKQLAEGSVRIPLACGHCYGTTLHEEDKGEAHCAGCGRSSKIKTLHTIRKQRIARFIRTGDL